MKKSVAKKLYCIAVALVAVCALVYVGFGDLITGRSEKVPYGEFYAQVKAGQVESAVISEKKIEYKVKDSSVSFVTDNLKDSMLVSNLMESNVDVKVAADGGEIASIIFDVIFYGVFIAIFAVVFVKFISPNTFKVVRHTGKKFDDVVGMDNLKRDMKQIMDIMQHPGEYAKKGVRMPKGILLEGEPGNGKTLFAKALAGEAKVNFIPTKATDFESMFMAIGPMKVKLLFKKARRRAPCIIFIDEFDGIGTRRNYSGSAIETENTRIVTALLNELDGFEASNGILVMAATNSIEALDEALIRPGRFDARVKVEYPDEKARLLLVEKYTAGKAMDSSLTAQVLAKRFAGFSCAKIESVINRAAIIASEENRAVCSGDIEVAVKEQASAK